MVPDSSMLYMPIALATRGTLSTIADIAPISPSTMYAFPNVLFNHVPNKFNVPVSCNAPTVSRMPRKNSMVDMSIFLMMLDTLTSFSIFNSLLLWRIIISVVIHSIASTPMTPTKGGSPVTERNTGTSIRPKTPIQKIDTLALRGNPGFLSACRCDVCTAGMRVYFFSIGVIISVGITTDINDGRNRPFIMPVVDTHPFIQSMMVVTSPIGENAPPAFAAMMTIPA